MKAMSVAACAVLIVNTRCPSRAEPKRPGLPKSTRSAAGARRQLLPGQGLLAGHSEAFEREPMGPVCGHQACGNETRDTCLLRPRGSESEMYDAESCDGADFGGASCGHLGYLGGTLGCSARCEWDLSGCDVCEPGECIIQPTVGGFAEVRSFSVTSEAQRIRLTWNTRERLGGVMQACTYTTLAGEPVVPKTGSCSWIGWPMYVQDVYADGDGSSGKPAESWGRPQWGMIADDECRVVDTGAAQFRILPREPALTASAPMPLVGQWFVDQVPYGAPLRIANDPLASGCIEGVLVDHALVIAWHSPAHGLVVRRLALPNLARGPALREDRPGRTDCQDAPGLSTRGEHGRCN